jgi:hypothetical protein
MRAESEHHWYLRLLCEKLSAYHYVAPVDGLYAFTAISDGHRAIVTLIDGSRCEDQELGCNAAGEAEFTSEVVRTLDAGQLVSVYVDGVDGSGTFELDIKPVAAACSSEVLPEETLVTATYETRTMSSSCSSVEIRNGVNLAQEMNDKTFQIDVPKAPTGCSGSCDLQIRNFGAQSHSSCIRCLRFAAGVTPRPRKTRY